MTSQCSLFYYVFMGCEEFEKKKKMTKNIKSCFFFLYKMSQHSNGLVKYPLLMQNVCCACVVRMMNE